MKRTLTLLITTALSGIITVLLFNWVSKEHIQAGDFYRFYPAHPVLFSSHFSLTESYTNITGSTRSHVYLTNGSKPDEIFKIDHALAKSSAAKIDISKFEPLRFYSVSIKIDTPYFYLSDGSVPFLFRGSIDNWKLTDSLPRPDNFKELVPISKTSFAIRSLNVQKHENEIGKITIADSISYYNHELLEKQVDGIFCTDGMLRYSPELNQLVYLYYYRNQYVISDTALQLLFRGRTIDTVSHAQVKIAKLDYDSHQSSQLINPPAVVNKRSCVYKRWLFVISQVKAKNENLILYDASTGVDVYDLLEHKYLLSFYLPDLQGEKVRDIHVAENSLFVLYRNSIERYNLNSNYFKPDEANPPKIFYRDRSGMNSRTPAKK